MASGRTIILKSYSDIRNEYPAAGAITPGSLVALDANGKVAVNANVSNPVATMFAIEDDLQGNTTRDDYAADDQVQTWHVQSGEEVLALIDSALDPAVGDYLEAGAGGELVAPSGTGFPQFLVIESKVVDADSNHRIAVRRI